MRYTIKKYIYLTAAFFIFTNIFFMVFAEENKPAGQNQNDNKAADKKQLLKNFLSEHKAEAEMENLSTETDTGRKVGNSYVDAIQEILNYKDMPDVFKLESLESGTTPGAPEPWQTPEESGRAYLLMLKYHNPLIRLYGMDALEAIKKSAEFPEDEIEKENVLNFRNTIKFIEKEYTTPESDMERLKQLKQLNGYIEPLLSYETKGVVNVPELVSAFDDADPLVQFYFASRLLTRYTNDIDQADSIIEQLSGKGKDKYSKALLANEAEMKKLFKESIDPDEFIIIGLLRQIRKYYNWEDWPDVERLQALYDKASRFARIQIIGDLDADLRTSIKNE